MQQEVNEREIIIVILIHKLLHRAIGSYTHSAGSVPPREQRIHQMFVDCPHYSEIRFGEFSFTKIL
jgi:hypothetical protein